MGIHRAIGDTIAFLDADDVWMPWHLELCAASLADHPDIAVTCTAPARWKHPIPARPTTVPDVQVPADPLIALLDDSFAIPQTAAVARRSALLAVGGYDERMRYAEDYDLWLRIAARYVVARVAAVGVRYRSHPGQASLALRQIFEGGFEARFRTLAMLTAAPDPERAARAAAALLRVYDSELHAAWYTNDADAFEYLLSLADRIAGAAPVRARWALRRRFGWGAYHAARTLKRRLLPSTEPRLA